LEVANFKAGCFNHRGLHSQQRSSWWNILVWFVKCASPMLKCFHSWVTEFEPCFYNCM